MVYYIPCPSKSDTIFAYSQCQKSYLPLVIQQITLMPKFAIHCGTKKPQKEFQC